MIIDNQQSNYQLPIKTQKQILQALESNIKITKQAPQISQLEILKNPRQFSNRELENNQQLYQLKQVIILQAQARKVNVQRRKIIFPNDRNKIDQIYFQRSKFLIEKARIKQGIPQIDCATGRKQQNQVSVLSMHKRQDSNKQLDKETLGTYRQIIKQVLKEFNNEFMLQFGEEPTKTEKEVLRQLYTDYKHLKQFSIQDQQGQEQSNHNNQQLQFSRQNSIQNISQNENQQQQKQMQPLQKQSSITQQVIQLQQYSVQAKQMLTINIPDNSDEAKVLKHKVQKFLQEYKICYDKTTHNVSEYKKQNKPLPIDLKQNWSQQIVEIYNQLYQIYKQLKAKCQ